MEMIQPRKSFLKFDSQTLKTISQVESFITTNNNKDEDNSPKNNIQNIAAAIELNILENLKKKNLQWCSSYLKRFAKYSENTLKTASSGEAPVLELWGVWSDPSWLILPSQLGPVVVSTS